MRRANFIRARSLGRARNDEILCGNSGTRQNKRQRRQSEFFRSVAAAHRTCGHLVTLMPTIGLVGLLFLLVMMVKRAMVAFAAAHRYGVISEGAQWRIEQDCCKQTQIGAELLPRALVPCLHAEKVAPKNKPTSTAPHQENCLIFANSKRSSGSRIQNFRLRKLDLSTSASQTLLHGSDVSAV